MQWTYDLQEMDAELWARRVVPTLRDESSPGDIVTLLMGDSPPTSTQTDAVEELIHQAGYRCDRTRVLGVSALLIYR